MGPAAAIMGAGSVRLDLYNTVTQAYSGLGDALEADKFEVTPDSDMKQKMSKSREFYGQAIASVIINKPTKLGLTISSASTEALAMQFQGLRAAWTQGAAAVIDEAVVARLGKWVKLANRNLSATAFAVKNSAGAITYVLNTDYQINYATGEIKPLAGGAIVEAQALKVSYTAIALAGEIIRGGVVPQIRCRAMWQGVNMVDNQEIECEIYEVVLTSKKGFDFLADDFNGIELEGTLVVPVGKTEPYVIRLKNV